MRCANHASHKGNWMRKITQADIDLAHRYALKYRHYVEFRGDPSRLDSVALRGLERAAKWHDKNKGSWHNALSLCIKSESIKETAKENRAYKSGVRVYYIEDFKATKTKMGNSGHYFVETGNDLSDGKNGIHKDLQVALQNNPDPDIDKLC
jgi:hypothetical protein